MKKLLLNTLKELCLYLVLCVGCLLMLQSIARYTSFNDHVGFLQFKQAYLHITVWKTAFYVHVFSCVFCLFAGFTQFSSYILSNHKHIHRLLGKLYVFNILFINFPVGFIMAVYANGEIQSKIAFITLDSLWFWFTLKALIEIKCKNIKAHKEYMMRSYALTLSAIALRSWKIILSHTFHIEPGLLYMIDAWMGFVPNLLFVEWLIRRKRKRVIAHT